MLSSDLVILRKVFFFFVKTMEEKMSKLHPLFGRHGSKDTTTNTMTCGLQAIQTTKEKKDKQ